MSEPPKSKSERKKRLTGRQIKLLTKLKTRIRVKGDKALIHDIIKFHDCPQYALLSNIYPELKLAK